MTPSTGPGAALAPMPGSSGPGSRSPRATSATPTTGVSDTAPKSRPQATKPLSQTLLTGPLATQRLKGEPAHVPITKDMRAPSSHAAVIALGFAALGVAALKLLGGTDWTSLALFAAALLVTELVEDADRIRTRETS